MDDASAGRAPGIENTLDQAAVDLTHDLGMPTRRLEQWACPEEDRRRATGLGAGFGGLGWGSLDLR
jgi:hypothetical protein